MTREEAINEIKSWDFLEGKEIEAIHTLIPELRESEDERIRKEIIDFIQWAEDRGMTRHDYHQAKRPAVWIAYLEKQKDERELGYIEGKVEGVRQTCQEIKDAMSLFEPKDLTPFEFTFRDYIDSAIRYCLSGEGYQQYIKEWSADLLNLEKQKEQKPAQSEEEKEYVRTLKGLVSDFIRDSGGGITDVEYYQNICDWLDGRHIEQKPVEYLSKDKVYAIMNKLTVLSLSELIPLNSDEYKKIHEITFDVRSLLDYPIEQKPRWEINNPYITKWTKEMIDEKYKELVEEYHKQKPEEWSEWDEQTINMAIETLEHEKYLILAERLKSLKPQPKSEWGEEDEEMLNSCISSIEESKENRYAYKENDGDTSYDREIAWLKSLPERFNLQPKQKQNDYITPHKEFFKFIYDRLINVHKENPNVDYMRSFKERLNNLSFGEKQEWSEEDEKMLQSIIKDFRAGKVSTIGQEQWLKSLRPSWKPSEEQEESEYYQHFDPDC